MPKNPFLNAGLAGLYIIIVTSVMNLASRSGVEDNFVAPIAFLSLFTLSVAIMGFLFVGEPLQLYLAGQKKQAVSFFLKTLLGFAVFTLLVWASTISGVLAT